MHDNKCGCGSCTPSWIQRLANAKVFLLTMCIFYVLYASHFAFLSSSLTTLERQFKLSGSEAGALNSINDFAIIFTVVFGCYFGYKSHRPRWIAAGSLTVGIGNILCALPHYLSDPLDTSNLIQKQQTDDSGLVLTNFLCSTNEPHNSINATESCKMEIDDNNGNISALTLVILGQILVGAGGGFIPALATTYIEDAVGRAHVLLYNAFFATAVAIGGIVGYVFTFFSDSLYVDFDRVGADDVPDIPLDDPRWIGAWWLGFVIHGFALILVSIPLSLFPRKITPELKEKNEKQPQENDETLEENAKITDILKTSGEAGGLLQTIKSFLPALKRTVCNLTLWLIALGDSIGTACVSAAAVNIPKFLVYQYTLSISTASLAMGSLIPLQVLAQFVSVFIVRRLKHSLQKSMILIIICRALAALFILPVFFAECPTADIAGYSVPYPESSVTNDLTPICNADCSCSNDDFFPVCGSDGITYTSPCQAGCTLLNATFGDGGQPVVEYRECSCLEGAATSATFGICPVKSSCRMYLLYFASVMLSLFFGSIAVQPEIYLMLRISKDKDRAVSLAFNSCINKVLGNLPAPIYFGALVNSACKLWQTTCGNRGNCWIYDVDDFRNKFHGLLVSIFIMVLVFNSAAYFTLPRDDKSDDNEMTPRKKAQKTESNAALVTQDGI